MNILITGGASGLGQAITIKMASEFSAAKIYITYNSSKENAEKLCRKYSNLTAIKCDFEKDSDIDSICRIIEDNSIDILVNNAIVNLNRIHFHKIAHSSFLEGFLKNILPIVKLTQSFISTARKKRFGKIISILSSYHHNAPPIGLSSYVAEKNYLYGLSKSWAVENASFNITSNCVSPGIMLTGLNDNTDPRILEQIILKNPLKKLLTVEEVADVVYFLATCSQQINGQDIVIDSSQTIN